MEGLHPLRRLRELDVAYNAISECVPPLPDPRAPSHNTDSLATPASMSAVRPLSLNPSLESLRLEGNPVSERRNCRHAIMHLVRGKRGRVSLAPSSPTLAFS